MRTKPPFAVVLTMMFPNCAGSAKRPLTSIGIWNGVLFGIGGMPNAPAGTCTFWAAIALATSSAVSPSAFSRFGSIHTRIA